MWKINELNSLLLCKEDKIKFITKNVVRIESKINGLNAEILKFNSELKQSKSETILKQQGSPYLYVVNSGNYVDTLR